MKKDKEYLLVFNSGSISLKYALFEKKELKLVSQEEIERIGLAGGIKNHEIAFKQVLDNLLKKGMVNDLKEIKLVAHRIVHGGDQFKEPTLLNDKNIKEIEKYSHLAPLHNPVNLLGVRIAKRLFPKAKQVAVFDTAFYKDLSPSHYLYALPYKFYQKNKIRRYGFHGIAHQYLYWKTNGTLKKKVDKLITCHLGGGSSITAIKNGKAVNTSMGFTPLEGLVMESRSGDIDPAIVVYLIDNLKIKAKEVGEILNNQSGYKGICGKKDMRKILKLKKKNHLAQLAYEMFILSAVKYIAYYLAEMGGVEAITFSGGMGARSGEIRKDITDHFRFLGLQLDSRKNKRNSLIVSSAKSKVKVLAIPANEELAIACQVVDEF
jgi:acetate kinase